LDRWGDNRTLFITQGLRNRKWKQRGAASTCLVSNVYFVASVWTPNSKANVVEEDAQLQISVKGWVEMSSFKKSYWGEKEKKKSNLIIPYLWVSKA
jgi:hypothetical protein